MTCEFCGNSIRSLDTAADESKALSELIQTAQALSLKQDSSDPSSKVQFLGGFWVSTFLPRSTEVCNQMLLQIISAIQPDINAAVVKEYNAPLVERSRALILALKTSTGQEGTNRTAALEEELQRKIDAIDAAVKKENLAWVVLGAAVGGGLGAIFGGVQGAIIGTLVAGGLYGVIMR